MLLNIFTFNDLHGYLEENPIQTLIIRRHIVFLMWFIKRAWAACDFTEKKKFTSRGKYFDYTAGFTVWIVTRSVPFLTGFCWHLGITSFHISRFLFPRGNLPVKNFNGKPKILNLSSSVVSREKRTVSSKRLVLDSMAFSPSEWTQNATTASKTGNDLP